MHNCGRGVAVTPVDHNVTVCQWNDPIQETIII